MPPNPCTVLLCGNPSNKMPSNDSCFLDKGRKKGHCTVFKILVLHGEVHWELLRLGPGFF